LNLSKEEFEINNKKVNELKESIEKEILKINNLYDKVNNEVTSYYQKQYEILVKEENELKEKLQNEVTKIKEKLEIFLSECINSIKINEKLNKGIEKMLKEKESIII
jgi:regulator of sigma D